MKETKIPTVKDNLPQETPSKKGKIIFSNWWMRGTSESVHEWDQRPPLEEKDRRPERQSQKWKSTKN